ncbi:arsenate reductase ArsC [Lacisediminimonas profundi]|uniref:arsenate reductase ArsC n=1 Tax=Lacisediminimonas profundi TaxID=2603856 RepID=UPI00124B6190|nr:arsenate reductase ArsC [Lacisediminimonas profundi]
MSSKVFNVLFLCTGNSARSIMAEALLNQMGTGRFRAFSAGSKPAGQVHPRTIELLERNGISTDNLRSKNWDEFAGPGAPQMDFVLSVCDKAAAEACPVWPGQPMSAHWGIEDPVSSGSDHDVQQRKDFNEAFATLKSRISFFLALPLDKIQKISLQNELGRIGKEQA